MTDPVATYRIQLTADFGFDATARLIPYLVRLGVSHLYLSPIFMSVPGSTHGYDLVDPDVVDLDRGGEQAFQLMVAAARSAGLGLLVDVVPNHMAADAANRRWVDALRTGAGGSSARWFDVGWLHGNDVVTDRTLVPLLPCSIGSAIDDGFVKLARGPDAIHVVVGGTELPLAVGSLHEIVGVESEIGQLLRDDPSAATAVDQRLAAINADAGALEALLGLQHYHLADWRGINDEIDRRRFFDVSDLVGVRQEDPSVRDSFHSRILQMCDEHQVDGLRIDHPDGLADPTGYFVWLRRRLPAAWLLAEKILAFGETLPDEWPIDGTTGYETGALIDRLFVDPASEMALDAVTERFTGTSSSFAEIAADGKRLMVDDVFRSELRRLVGLLGEGLDLDEVDDDAVGCAVRALLVAMPVYRTYIGRGERANRRDSAVMGAAMDAAHHDLSPDSAATERRALAAIADLLSRSERTSTEEELVCRLQQVSAAIMAKGVEDTAFYRYPRLLSLNEVGADPSHFAASVADFHSAQAFAATDAPMRMVSLGTHDSKRSADARLRLCVLSEIPELWREVAEALDERLRTIAGPIERDPVVDLAVVQSVIAADPIDRARLDAVVTKTAREAKRRTSWLHPDDDHERQLHELAGALTTDEDCRAMVDRLTAVVVPVGRANSLSATLIVLTIPGVPDLYQGSELWSLTLVDPDNRRPVDYELRTTLMTALRTIDERASGWANDLADDDVGASKLFLIVKGLALRRSRPDCFRPGSEYAPLLAHGTASDHVIAFRRGRDVITVASRLRWGLGQRGGWRDTDLLLPPGEWADELGGVRVSGTCRLERLLEHGPCALLVRSADV